MRKPRGRLEQIGVRLSNRPVPKVRENPSSEWGKILVQQTPHQLPKAN
jgi:hypothetical protein